MTCIATVGRLVLGRHPAPRLETSYMDESRRAFAKTRRDKLVRRRELVVCCLETDSAAWLFRVDTGILVKQTSLFLFGLLEGMACAHGAVALVC